MSYPWKNLDPKDTLQIVSNQWITEVDVHVLTSLYKPIMKQPAYGLYMTLKSFIELNKSNKDKLMLSLLISELDIGIPEFYQARIRLEALGLLETHRHVSDSDMYVYQLNKPLNPKEFFDETILRTLLFEKVGETSYKQLNERFVTPKLDLQNYENITKSFLDVFDFDMNHVPNIVEDEHYADNEGKHRVSQSILESDSFDWGFFKSGLNKHFIDQKTLTNSVKETILTYHLLYKIDELSMQRYVLEATDVESGKINEDSLVGVLQRVVQKENINIQDKVESTLDNMKTEKTISEYHLKQKGYSEMEIEVIVDAREKTPGQYLKSIKDQKKGFVDSAETWTLKDLAEKSHLPTSVINILINYVLVIKDKPTLDKKLTMTIANDWAQKSVDTPEKALDAIKDLYSKNQPQSKQKKSYNNRKNPKVIRKETMPKWANEPNDKEDKIDPETEKMFREKLRQLREN